MRAVVNFLVCEIAIELKLMEVTSSKTLVNTITDLNTVCSHYVHATIYFLTMAQKAGACSNEKYRVIMRFNFG
jgi:hypothetical protein